MCRVKCNNIAGRRTSSTCSCLLQNIVKLFICWIRTKSEPRKRIVFIVAEDLVQRPSSVPADSRVIIVRYQHDVCPAVVASDHLERLGDSRKRSANTHRCVVGHVVIHDSVATPFREERAVPVGHHVPRSNTHCIQSTFHSIIRLVTCHKLS